MEAHEIVTQAAIEAETAIRTLEDIDLETIEHDAKDRLERAMTRLQEIVDELSELSGAISLADAPLLAEEQ
jgi:selenocysteine lyase/cysteine desulfurase